MDHSQIINRLEWMWERYPFEANEVACQKTPLSFVDCIWEFFGSLLRGIRAVIIPDEVVKDTNALVRALSSHKVTRIWLVPSALRNILESQDNLSDLLPHLRFWVASEEPLAKDIVERFLRALPHARLYNLYGTSEVWDATWQDPGTSRQAADILPIGRPISNVRVYLLDDRRHPVPIGVAGEIYVGGAGLARGYVNRPDLTLERFLPDPFIGGDARMYRTGDLAKFTSDGSIDYLGRMDHQVKIRGCRIEVAEVELAIANHPGIRQVAVTAYTHNSDTGLVAFIVAARQPAPTVGELREFLKTQLPSFMVPDAFLPMDALPMTPSGKINRSALPPFDGRDRVAAVNYVLPETPLEKGLAEIWKNLLGLKMVSRHEHFFEAGGHSLLATRLVSQIQQSLGIKIPFRLIFDHPVLSKLAVALESLRWAAENQAAQRMEVESKLQNTSNQNGENGAIETERNTIELGEL